MVQALLGEETSAEIPRFCNLGQGDTKEEENEEWLPSSSPSLS